MARFLVVFSPREGVEPQDLIAALDPLVSDMAAEVENRTTAHLSAMLRDANDNLRLQLFADVQARSRGAVLELVLMSREPMGRGAPLTRDCFTRLVTLAERTLPDLQVAFRSDRDGPLPDRR